MTPTATYRFYDAAGVLLYVGITTSPWNRFASHEHTEWARHADLTRTRIRWYATRRAAKAAETRAIKTERPVYNLAENTHPAHPPIQLAFGCGCQGLDQCSLDVRHGHDWFGLRWNAGRLQQGGCRGKGAIVSCRTKTIAEAIAELTDEQRAALVEEAKEFATQAAGGEPDAA